MSEQMRESLSAMLDDEASELEVRRVLKVLGEDAELAGTWRRYQAIHAAMAGRDVEFLHLEISGRVREAIEGQSGHTQRTLLQRWVRPLTSFAVAASVATTVVIGGQQLVRVSDDPYDVQAASSGGVSPVGMINSLGAVPVRASFGTASLPVLQPVTHSAYNELARQRLQMYMQEHAEHAALNSPQGLILFARVPEIEE